MNDSRDPNSRSSIVVSDIRGHTIVETVFRPETGDTALVVMADDVLVVAPEWKVDAETYVPPHASNNLIRHHALLLPSVPLEYKSTRDLLVEIQTYIRHYVSLSDPAAGISAAYVLLSWVYDAFNELP